MAWVKGQSGNPAGRKSPGAKLARLIRSRTADGQELVEFALEVFKGDHGATLRERMEAHKWLADRGFGKAVETLVIEDERPADMQPAAIATDNLEAELGPEGTIQ